MNLRPPVPTSDKLPKNEAQGQRRAAILPVILGLVLVLGLAGLSALNRAPQSTPAAFDTGQMNSEDVFEEASGPNDHLSDDQITFTPPQSVDATLSLRPFDAALEEEPAGLPTPEHGQRIAAFQRNEGQLHEEYALWNISNTPVTQIMAFYEQAATELHFEQLSAAPANRATTTPAVPDDSTAIAEASGAPTVAAAPAAQKTTAPVTMIFTRNRQPKMTDGQKLPAANDVLIVRAKAAAQGKVKVTLWYRHAIYTSQK